MTTATESYEQNAQATTDKDEPDADDPINKVHTKIIKNNSLDASQTQNNPYAWAASEQDEEIEVELSNYSMLDAMDQQLLKNIEQYVVQNMSRGQMSLEEMASAMGMGRVPFFHRVRNLTGKTPAELVRDLRLKHACILLKRTNINMSELATNVGFMTGENFINIFREKFGMTPLEYRLRHRK
jgi:transcriptional regulator GlxA family with amidase domain